MPSAGRMRPNTVSAGSCTTPRHRPVRTMTLSRTLVNRPKKPFQSPGTQRRTAPAVVPAFMSSPRCGVKVPCVSVPRAASVSPVNVQAPRIVLTGRGNCMRIGIAPMRLRGPAPRRSARCCRCAAVYARQPPNAVISRCPSHRNGSPSTPSTTEPSFSTTLPIARPGGSFCRIWPGRRAARPTARAPRCVPAPGVRSIAGWRSPIDQIR